MEAEVARLKELGAQIVRIFRPGEGGVFGGTWTVMQDPEGNEFCVEGEE